MLEQDPAAGLFALWAAAASLGVAVAPPANGRQQQQVHPNHTQTQNRVTHL